MIINFQQGIVTYPMVGNQQSFLSRTGSFVSLSTTNGVVDVTFAHGTENYYHTEASNVPNAWGPIVDNTDYWLYWDINLRTAVRTFGVTVVQPVYSASTPASPVDDLHWFNTNTRKMQVFTTGQFREVIRVFAARVNNNTFSPLSTGSYPFAGSQAGLGVANVNAGRILADADGKPIKRQSGAFFTTESLFFLNGSPINTIRLETSVQYATAAENLAKFQVVTFTNFGQISGATYTDVQESVIALVLADLQTNEVGEVCIQGIVTNHSWNWPHVGTPLWVDSSGNLIDVDPHLSFPLSYPVGKPPIARVLTQTSIFFDQGLGGKGADGATSSGANVTAATPVVPGIARLSITAVDPGDPIVVGTNDLRMSNARTPTVHSHPASGITVTPTGNITASDVQSALAELDTAIQAGGNFVNRTGDTMTGPLVLPGEPTNDLQAADKGYVDRITKLQPFTNVQNTNHTCVPADLGTVIRVSSIETVNVIVSASSSLLNVPGSVLYVRQTGTAPILILPDTGVTFNVPDGFIAKTARFGSVISLHCVGTDEWDLTGDLAIFTGL